MPLISVVTPVWNGLPYLKQAAESVLNQEFIDWEWIISDDGSSDGSIQYLMNLQSSSGGFIRFYAQPNNLGIFGNLNFLANKARSDLIQILCQDDYFATPNTLSSLFAKWQSLPSSIGASRWNSHDLDDAVGLKEEIEPSSSQLLFFLNGNLPGNLSNIAFRKSAWASIGLFDERFPYAGDFYYWALFARTFSIKLLPENGVYVRCHANQASFYLNKTGDLYPQLTNITSEIYAHIPRKAWLNDFALRIAGTLVYDSEIRRGLILRAIGGGSLRYRSFLRSSSDKVYLVNPLLRWLLFFATMGGIIGKKAILNLAYTLNSD